MTERSTSAREVNFDGLPGLTHNYGGLSFGNVASKSNKAGASNPKAAALQGVAKMRHLNDMGLTQGILPPHERPFIHGLRRLGFTGSDHQILDAAWQNNPALVASFSSASAMWTANAATISPSADTTDGRVHITPANLVSMPHRALEHPVTGRILQAAFKNDRYFAHHPALPAQESMGDEGAANHTRFAAGYGDRGVEFFVVGKYAFRQGPAPTTFPARQTFEASEAIARQHGLDPAHTVYALQHPDLIDAGVFHNDVISVGNLNCLFHYQDAFVDTPAVLAELHSKLAAVGADFVSVEVPKDAVPVEDVVKSYLFNSQLLARPDGKGMKLILPVEAEETESVKHWLDDLMASGSIINDMEFLDLRQSMKNGGGPACLRLRIVLTDDELAAANQAMIMDHDKLDIIENWINRHYRDSLTANDLGDPALLDEGRAALDELTQILALGPVYDFQRP